MIYKKNDMNGYSLHTIETNKFKLCHMEIIFRNNVNEHDITKRNVLFDALSECSKGYPTKRELSLKLESLYGATLYSVTSKVGNMIITNFCLDFINPKYTEDDHYLEECFSLIFEMLFNPLTDKNEFDAKLVDYIKEKNLNDLKSIGENPKKLATLNALNTLDKNSPSHYGSIGSIEDLEEVNPENLFSYYHEVLQNDYVDIYLIGDLKMSEIPNLIAKYVSLRIIKNHPISIYYANLKRKAIIKSDQGKYAQSNLVVLLNLNKLSSYEKKYVANIYNIILGGGSLETKLYQRLRNDNSLCYNVTSSYQKYDGLIIINTAVDVNASKRAVKLIKMAIKDMTNNISDDELSKAKELILTSLAMTMDNIGRIVDNYFYQDISDLDDYETRIKTFKNISKEEIYKLGKKVSISTVYILNGGE